MKGIIGIFVVGVVACVASVVILGKSANDDSYSTAVGFSDPVKGKMIMHVAVALLTSSKDPPKMEANGLTPRWNDWIESHYQLFDSKRQPVELFRTGGSNIIPDKKAGNPEFFLAADVNEGEEYTFDYIPIKKEKKRYRWKFTAPSEKETKRPKFEPVK